MSKLLTSITAGLAIILAIGPASAEMLCSSNQSPKSLYSDQRAAKVGDTLTVIVVESSSSSQQASSNASKDTSTSIASGVGPLLHNLPAIKFGGGDSLKSSGATSRTMTLSTRMTVKVTAIDTNGNLQIEGSRSVKTNKETEEVKITGTVRPQDIASDNTILSTSIADAKISQQGKGPIGSREHEGIITKLLKLIF